MKQLQLFALIASLSAVSSQVSAGWTQINYFKNGKYTTQNIYSSKGITIINDQVIYPSNATIITDPGKTETKKVDIAGVKAIDASDFGNLTIEQCATCPEILTITADENIMPHLQHELSGIFNKQLNLGLKDDVVIETLTPINFHVNFHAVVKDINKLSTRNSIQATTNNIETDSLEIDMYNSSTLDSSIKVKKLTANLANSAQATLNGEAIEQNLHLSNSAKYNAQNLTSKNTRIKTNNSAFAQLRVMQNLYYKASNSSKIFYSGNAQAQGSTSKSAKIRKI